MENIEDLLKIGIRPTDELNTVERTEIIKKLSLLMSKNISTLAYNENENYMRLFNIKISYADFDLAENEIIYGVDETKQVKYKFNGVYYSENNNMLFLSKEYDIENPDETIFKQVFRYMQSNNSKPRNRMLNTLTKYLAYLSAGNKVHKITDDIVTIDTISDELDKFSMGIAAEIVMLCSEAEIIEGTLVDSEDLDQYLANEFKGSINTIEHELDTIVSLERNKYYDENKIVDHFLKVQEMLYQSYFNNKILQLFSADQIDEQVAKLNKFEKMLGVRIDGSNKSFISYKEKIQTQFFDKYVESRNVAESQAMVLVRHNPFKDLLRKIVMRFKKSNVTS